jgi:hypothetical protein
MTESPGVGALQSAPGNDQRPDTGMNPTRSAIAPRAVEPDRRAGAPGLRAPHPCCTPRWLLQMLGRSDAPGTTGGALAMCRYRSSECKHRSVWGGTEWSAGSVRISAPGVDGIVFETQRIPDLVLAPSQFSCYNEEVVVRREEQSGCWRS